MNARNHVCVLAVDGMTCNSCVDLIQHAVSQMQGVNTVKVRLYITLWVQFPMEFSITL